VWAGGELAAAGGARGDLAGHQGVAVGAGGAGAHVGQAVGREGVLQLAGHHGGPPDGVGGVTHAQVVLREGQLGSDAWLEENGQSLGLG